MGKIFRLTGVPAAMHRAAGSDVAEITASLRAQGFVAWDNIEQGSAGTVWHVENARALNSRSYDLRVMAGSLEVMARLREA